MIEDIGKIIIENNSIIFERIVGFSKGVAELAPKNPPPFVPKCLIDSNAAIGPSKQFLEIFLQLLLIEYLNSVLWYTLPNKK